MYSTVVLTTNSNWEDTYHYPGHLADIDPECAPVRIITVCANPPRFLLRVLPAHTGHRLIVGGGNWLGNCDFGVFRER